MALPNTGRTVRWRVERLGEQRHQAGVTVHVGAHDVGLTAAHRDHPSVFGVEIPFPPVLTQPSGAFGGAVDGELFEHEVDLVAAQSR